MKELLESELTPLKLNLQFFSEKDKTKTDDDEDKTETDEPTDTDVDEGDNDEGSGGEEPKFTQADLDRIVKERLAREKRKAEEEAEKRRKEEEGEYKELYETSQKEFAEFKRKNTVETLMLKAGYTEEQVGRYAKFVDGDEESDIKASLDVLIEDIPPTTVERREPGAGPRIKQEPTPKDGVEYGKELLSRIKK